MSTGIESHIRVDDSNVAWVDDTNVKVIEVVVDKLAYGSSPEEMHRQYPHLSLSQIHSALAYYYDHQVDMDVEIQRQLDEIEQLRAQAGESPIRERSRQAGKLP